MAMKLRTPYIRGFDHKPKILFADDLRKFGNRYITCVEKGEVMLRNDNVLSNDHLNCVQLYLFNKF